MRILINRKIDLSNYNENELMLNGNVASSLSIQLKANGGSITVSGKNINADDYVTLTGIDAIAMSTITTLNSDGIYSFDISGVDSVKINAKGNTKSVIYMKVMD